jgi:hypothetical protein
LINTIPFSKARFPAPQDFTKQKIFRHAGTIRKLGTYFEIPAFSIPNPWKGASEIVLRFDYEISNFTFFNPFVDSRYDDINFCPVISWFSAPEVITRYKLKSNVGEILWLPEYAGQKINNSSFYIEIWNTDNGIYEVLGTQEGDAIGTQDGQLIGITPPTYADLILEDPIRFYTSRLIAPPHKCDTDDIEIGNRTLCVDPIYFLEDFEPFNGDYYLLVSPCQRLLVKGRISPVFENILLQSTDGTWHYVYAQLNTDDSGDFLGFNVDQADQPPGDKGYFPLREITGTTHKIDLLAHDDGDGLIHYLRIGDPVIDPDFYHVLRLNSIPDLVTRSIRLIRDDVGELVLNIQ